MIKAIKIREMVYQDCKVKFSQEKLGKVGQIGRSAKPENWDTGERDTDALAEAMDEEMLRGITGKEYGEEEVKEIQEMVRVILEGKKRRVENNKVVAARDVRQMSLMKKYWVVVDAVFKLRTMAVRMKLFAKLEMLLEGITAREIEEAGFNAKVMAIKNMWSMIHDIADNLINMQFIVTNIDNRKDITILQQRAYNILKEKLGEGRSVNEISAKLKELTEEAVIDVGEDKKC